MEFGERLKKLRNEKNMSQDTLGKQVGLTRSSIGNYELGFNMPTADILAKIADVLDCSLDYLMGRAEYTIVKDVPFLLSSSDSTCNLDIEGLNEEDIIELQRLADYMKKQKK